MRDRLVCTFRSCQDDAVVRADRFVGGRFFKGRPMCVRHSRWVARERAHQSPQWAERKAS